MTGSSGTQRVFPSAKDLRLTISLRRAAILPSVPPAGCSNGDGWNTENERPGLEPAAEATRLGTLPGTCGGGHAGLGGPVAKIKRQSPKTALEFQSGAIRSENAASPCSRWQLTRMRSPGFCIANRDRHDVQSFRRDCRDRLSGRSPTGLDLRSRRRRTHRCGAARRQASRQGGHRLRKKGGHAHLPSGSPGCRVVSSS